MFEAISLETDKVMLTPLKQVHLESLLKAGSHPDIWQCVFFNYCENKPVITKWFEETAQFNSQSQLVMAIIDKTSNTLVGTTRLFRLDPVHQSAEIGHTFIAKSAQKTHVNTHAKYLLLNHAFEQLNLTRVTFCTHENNSISRNAIARLGARFEGIAYKQRKLPDGTFRNTATFSIVDEQWPSIKENLIAQLSRG
ncbi:N-acetyltransferase [Pseudoalteromonas phenolica]|uniref:N-acetyltransferase n=1 Tax=Pseudoalteromonas phenolica TaxID=161398 RepID=A0A4Q7IUQ1_9GAMM|nr:GNAT family protein [Pseudoalteromonas phenolica]RZQ55067.1 N-acetyltransferase [Pseudoalteromonas phenolica]